MRIGIDIRNLTVPINGIRRYTENILNNFPTTEHEFFLYTPSPLHTHNLQLDYHLYTDRFETQLGRIFWGLNVLPRLLKKDSIDLFWSPAHRLPFTFLMPKRIKTVVTIHDLVWRLYPQTMPRLSKYAEQLLMPYAISNADQIITVSKLVASNISEFFPHSASKVNVIPEGYNIFSRINAANQKHTDGLKQPYFLFIGTNEPRKNLKRLVLAYALLLRSASVHDHLVIAGGHGWGESSLIELVQSLNLSDKVHILGRVSDKELHALYNDARAFVMPSLYEGFGLPVLEAMSFGLPIVTTENSAMSEIAADAAIYVNPYEVESIKNGMLSLISDGRLSSRLSKISHARAKMFTWNAAADKTLHIFQKSFLGA